MRIRRMLQISTLAGFASVMTVAGTISTLLVLDRQHAHDAQRLDNAVRKIASMRSLLPDFLRSANPRATQQWQTVYRELGPLLNDLPARDERAEAIKSAIIQEQVSLGKLFEHLSRANGGTPISMEMREMVTGQLGVRSASMVSDVLTIRDLRDRQIGAEKRWGTAAVAVSVAVLVGVILALMRIMYRRIAVPIAKLELAAGRMSAGHLDQPVAVAGSDDVVALARSFDHMRSALRDRLRDLGETKARLEDANTNLEQRVVDRTRELAEANEAKSRFFANVSHELRTPLALILGPVDEILADRELPPEHRRDLEVVRRNAQTLLAYVIDLLDLSRFDAGRMQLAYSEADLARIVRLVADHFSSASSQRGIDLYVTAPETLAAQVDSAKIGRVLFNLMSNAFKHLPDRGGRVKVALSADAGKATIEVVDNGPGIPRDMRAKIFERFVQGNDPQRSAGTGLGLTIANEFVAQHGGSIVVEDAPGGTGALFRVVLPLVAPEGTRVAETDEAFGDLGAVATAPQVIPSEEIMADDPPSLPQVLVVEDNPDLRAFIAKTLRRVARVAVAEDGEEGLAVAERLRPDLVLTDIMMPRMSGDRMVAEMRARADLADLPVMVLSARADEPLRIRLLRGQAQDYLVKPFAADELQARVANLLQVKRARDLLRAELASREENLEDLARDVAALNRTLRTAADEMRVAKDRAEEASKAKSAFLNMVSHELRTPLTQLELHLTLLQRLFRGALTDDQEDVLAGLTTALHRLSQLVSSVLEYSRVESGRLTVHPERFDAAKLVAEVCADFQRDAKRRGLELACGSDGDVPPLVSDPGLLRIAVHNLLDNAVKYTERGRVSARVSAEDGHQRIEIVDTGLGIMPEFQQRVFEPFEVVEDIDHKHIPGIGLGLALVREIAAALGGQVSLASAPGKGSTFGLTLPCLEGKYHGATVPGR